MVENKVNKKINIVHINDSFYPYCGGSTYRLLNLLKGVTKESSQFNFVVITKNYNRELPKKERLEENILIVRFKEYREIPLLLQNISHEITIDIIHAHNYRPAFFALLGNIFLKKPFIIEMHSLYKVSYIKQIIGRFSLRKADKLIVLSEKAKYYLVDVCKIKKEKISIVYNGIDINFFKNYELTEYVNNIYERIIHFLSKFELKIGYIGTFYEWQGVYNFIDIAKEIIQKRNDIGFLMVGGGPDYLKIKYIIEKENLSNRIFIHSSVPYKDIPFFYKLIDILLIPRPSTLSTEIAIPLKPLEALACEKIIVGTKVGGLSELQKKFQNNIFLFDSMQEISLFLQNYNKSEVCSQKDLIKEIQYFSDSSQAKKLIKVYREVMTI